MELEIKSKKKVYEKKRGKSGVSESTNYAYKLGNGKQISGTLKLPTDELEVDDKIEIKRITSQTKLVKKK